MQFINSSMKDRQADLENVECVEGLHPKPLHPTSNHKPYIVSALMVLVQCSVLLSAMDQHHRIQTLVILDVLISFVVFRHSLVAYIDSTCQCHKLHI